MTFEHPGQLYLRKRKTVETIDDVLTYAEFLRIEAGLDETLPVNLKAIFDHFDIPEPKTLLLSSNLQGLLVDSERGLMVINSNDPTLRQKFTKAHELAELLFSQLPVSLNLLGQPNRPGGYSENTKEFLCNWIAANLLMPPQFIKRHIQDHGVNFESAKIVASECEVSLNAALVQLTRLSPECHIVILWRMKNKPSEIKGQKNNEQMLLDGFEATEQNYPKKLRVEWALCSRNSPFIPKDKSTDDNSVIYKAWQSGVFSSGDEKLCFQNKTYYWYSTENLPFKINDERVVLSLIKRLVL